MSVLTIENGVYYHVNNERYASKLDGLARATELNKELKWHFHNEVFDAVTWNQPPSNLDLVQLYQERAKRLRETYDYLVLSYSGGSDSWTILQSFLKQGLYPDEILTMAPKKFLDQYFVTNASDNSAENHYSEWELQQERNLKWVASNYPQIKITVYDFTDDLALEMPDDYFHRVTNMFNYSVMRKQMFPSFPHILDLQQKGKKVASIIGNDKPQILFKDNKYFTYFLDKLTGHCRYFPGATIERFFWSPDSVDILRAQSWLVYNHFKMNPSLNNMIGRKRTDMNQKNMLDDVIRFIVYKEWTEVNKLAPFFYTRKNKFELNCETVILFDGYLKQVNALDSWKSKLTALFSRIDPKYYHYVDGKLDGLVSMISNVYYLGDL